MKGWIMRWAGIIVGFHALALSQPKEALDTAQVDAPYTKTTPKMRAAPAVKYDTTVTVTISHEDTVRTLNIRPHSEENSQKEVKAAAQSVDLLAQVLIGLLLASLVSSLLIASK